MVKPVFSQPFQVRAEPINKIEFWIVIYLLTLNFLGAAHFVVFVCSQYDGGNIYKEQWAQGPMRLQVLSQVFSKILRK